MYTLPYPLARQVCPPPTPSPHSLFISKLPTGSFWTSNGACKYCTLVHTVVILLHYVIQSTECTTLTSFPSYPAHFPRQHTIRYQASSNEILHKNRKGFQLGSWVIAIYLSICKIQYQHCSITDSGYWLLKKWIVVAVGSRKRVDKWLLMSPHRTHWLYTCLSTQAQVSPGYMLLWGSVPNNSSALSWVMQNRTRAEPGCDEKRVGRVSGLSSACVQCDLL